MQTHTQTHMHIYTGILIAALFVKKKISNNLNILNRGLAK